MIHTLLLFSLGDWILVFLLFLLLLILIYWLFRGRDAESTDASPNGLRATIPGFSKPVCYYPLNVKGEDGKFEVINTPYVCNELIVDESLPGFNELIESLEEQNVAYKKQLICPCKDELALYTFEDEVDLIGVVKSADEDTTAIGTPFSLNFLVDLDNFDIEASDQGIEGPNKPTPKAEVQFINNSPFQSLENVDVYINGKLAIVNFTYQTATPFFELPAGEKLSIAIAQADNSSVNTIFATQSLFLRENEKYVIIVSGTDENQQGEGSITVHEYFPAKTSSTNPKNLEILSFHGALDTPSLSFQLGDIALANNFSFGNFNGEYIPVSPKDTTLEVSPENPSDFSPIRFLAPFSELAGNTMVLLASGFIGSEGEKGFSVLGVFPDGSVVKLTNTSNEGEINIQVGQEPGPAVPQSEALVSFSSSSTDIPASTVLSQNIFVSLPSIVLEYKLSNVFPSPFTLPIIPVPTFTKKIGILDSGVDTRNMESVLTGIGWNKAALTSTCHPSVPATTFGVDISTPNGEPKDKLGHGCGVNSVFVNPLYATHEGGRLEFVNAKFTEGSSASGTLGNLICGLYYLVNEGVDVINISAGFLTEKTSFPILEEAIKFAEGRGVILVAGIGNGKDEEGDRVGIKLDDPDNNLFFEPARTISQSDMGVTVGAFYKDPSEGDQVKLAPFSNWANFSTDPTIKTPMSLAAEGVNIVCRIPEYILDDPTDSNEVLRSGTSFASPQVAAAIAVMQGLAPGLSEARIREILLSNTASFTLPDGTDGKMLNTSAAIEAVKAIAAGSSSLPGGGTT